MYSAPTLLSRLAVAKMVGLMIGLTGFLLVPLITPGAPDMARWGLLLWYPTMGAVIAMVEVLDTNGLLPWRLTWWMRGAVIGGWFNLLAVLMGGDFMQTFAQNLLGTHGVSLSVFIFVPEGAGAGMLIAYLVMRFGGEGRAIEDD
ncbi:MAG: hypothetical protein AAFR44_01340 [Pseudomonadota bacterium]